MDIETLEKKGYLTRAFCLTAHWTVVIRKGVTVVLTGRITTLNIKLSDRSLNINRSCHIGTLAPFNVSNKTLQSM